MVHKSFGDILTLRCGSITPIQANEDPNIGGGKAESVLITVRSLSVPISIVSIVTRTTGM